MESPEPATVFVSLSWSLKTGFHINNSSGILEFVTVILIFHYAYDHNLHNRATCYLCIYIIKKRTKVFHKNVSNVIRSQNFSVT